MSTSPQVPLRNPIIAGVLAFLFPGAGHCYQRRYFKAFVFAICVWGSWWTGMAMSDWKALQAPPVKERSALAVKLKYAGQVGVGAPALWALYQSNRYHSPQNRRPESVGGEISLPFQGNLSIQAADGLREELVQGTVHLQDTEGRFGPAITGTFEIDPAVTGTFESVSGKFQLDSNVSLDRPYGSSRAADFSAGIVDDQGKTLGSLRGTTPRPFLHWFACPLDKLEEENWHRDLGKYQELAMVFVWIAGLMNLLAIWDAVEGPAYGFDDSEEKPPAPAAA